MLKRVGELDDGTFLIQVEECNSLVQLHVREQRLQIALVAQFLEQAGDEGLLEGEYVEFGCIHRVFCR